MEDKDYLNVLFATSLVQTCGLGNFDQIELSKYMTGKQASVSPSISAYNQGFNGSSSVKDFEVMLQLLYAYATSIHKDTAAFSAWKLKMKTAYKNQRENPKSLFSEMLIKTVSSNHPRAISILTDDQINSIDLDRAIELYKERFADAGKFNFFFVGNFDVKEITPLLEKYIGGLPNTNKHEN